MFVSDILILYGMVNFKQNVSSFCYRTVDTLSKKLFVLKHRASTEPGGGSGAEGECAK